MDPGRPKIPISTEMPTPGQSGLETVVRRYSVQLTKLNTELTTAFSQVTGVVEFLVTLRCVFK